MFNYAKLIKENSDTFTNPEQLEDFLDAYMQDNQEVSEQEDNLHEYADGLVPIYYNDIDSEWRENGQCHGEAHAQGLIGTENDTYKIRQADLFTMYYDELSSDFNTLTDLIDDMD